MNIRVTNLSPDTPLSALRAWFEAFGEVLDVSISTYHIKGERRATGSVGMLFSRQARSAMAALRSKELVGTTMAIEGE